MRFEMKVIKHIPSRQVSFHPTIVQTMFHEGTHFMVHPSQFSLRLKVIADGGRTPDGLQSNVSGGLRDGSSSRWEIIRPIVCIHVQPSRSRLQMCDVLTNQIRPIRVLPKKRLKGRVRCGRVMLDKGSWGLPMPLCRQSARKPQEGYGIVVCFVVVKPVFRRSVVFISPLTSFPAMPR